jgi:hypothetical protein
VLTSFNTDISRITPARRGTNDSRPGITISTVARGCVVLRVFNSVDPVL